MNNLTPHLNANMQRLQAQRKEKLQAVYDHLIKTNQSFCFLQSTGEMITREHCEKYLLTN